MLALVFRMSRGLLLLRKDRCAGKARVRLQYPMQHTRHCGRHCSAVRLTAVYDMMSQLLTQAHSTVLGAQEYWALLAQTELCNCTDLAAPLTRYEHIRVGQLMPDAAPTANTHAANTRAPTWLPR